MSSIELVIIKLLYYRKIILGIHIEVIFQLNKKRNFLLALITQLQQKDFFNIINMVEQYAIARLRNELRELTQTEDSGFSVGLKDDNWFEWSVSFPGPEETPYEGGFYLAKLKFPNDYPNSPPEMVFETEMWHPNIFSDGRVCISILHSPGVDIYNPAESSAER